MLGNYGYLLAQADGALKRLARPVAARTYPRPLCVAGVGAGYAIKVIEKGIKGAQTLYFTTDWQPLAMAPANAAPCCDTTPACSSD